MPVQANFVYKIPKDASYVTLRNQNRMLYANYRIQQNNTQSGCQGVMRLENGGPAAADLVPKLVQGAREITEEELLRILASQACPAVPSAPAPIPEPPSDEGSMNFSASFGSVGSGVAYANDASLALGSGAFTIEWFQYLESEDSFPRAFSIGGYPSASIALSIEGGDVYFWRGGTNFNSFSPTTLLNTWTHFAIVGETSTIKIYQDGNLKLTYTGAYNFSNTTTALTIGNETGAATNAGAFDGQITNFRWVKGTAVYTNTFTPPSAPLTAIAGTQLLLLASNETDVVKDSSSAARTPTNTGVTFSTTSPF